MGRDGANPPFSTAVVARRELRDGWATAERRGDAKSVGVNRPMTSTHGPMPRRSLLAVLVISALTPCVAMAQQPFPSGVFEAGGRARATIAADGSMHMEMLGDSPVGWMSHVRVHADTLWLSDQSPACASAGEGSYRWTYDG